uniref:Putative conserved secreted protein n=1 Tax=Panstrongylus lignarius TaxID=156445 RepID=A0A224XG88_9HEMI
MRIWEVWVCVMTAAVLGVMGGSGGGASGGGSLESADLAWLLVQESPSSQPQTGAQVSVRRITPKSVFLAPTFTSCSEGYRQDSLGRCVKVVKVNPSAQWDFFLHKLNSMYGPPEPNSKPNTGPFRLPIPLATESPTTTTTTIRTTTTTELPISSTITEQSLSTTVLSTTTEEPTTDAPFLIVVANTTEQPTTVITETTSTTIPNTPPITSTTNEPTSDITTTLCDDCEEATTTFTITTPSTIPAPLKTTIIFPESNRNKRPSSSLVRFPESQQQSPYWWPHSWEHRLWQPPPAYYPPRQSAYRGHREARPAWQH